MADPLPREPEAPRSQEPALIMKRRRNAPITKRDKKALKRILRSHKGRGNRCNPYRSDLVPRSKSGRSAYKKRLKHMSPSARRAMILALANPKRYSRQKRKSTKGRALTKFRRAGKNQWLNGQYGPRNHKMSRRKFSKWTTARHRAGRRLSREDLGPQPPRRNPKRSRKWRSGGTKMPALKREWKKRWSHGRRTSSSGHRESSARSRRMSRRNCGR